MTNLKSLLAEASEWMRDHWPELPNESTVSLGERIDAALAADEPKADPQFPWGVRKDMTYVPTAEFQAMKAELESLRALNRTGDV